MRKKKTAPIIIALLILIAGGLGYFVYHFYSLNEETKAQNAELLATQELNSKYAYVALQDIRAGEEIIVDYNVEYQQIYSGVDSLLFWEPWADTNVATADIACGIPVMTSMVAEKEVIPGARDLEICVAQLMTTQEDFDYIDVRIAFPDGSDYVVLSKKMVEDLRLENCVFTTEAKEEEIVLMTSAILDSYLNLGTQIYVTRYTDPSLQEPSAVTYCPKAATLALLGSSNPNLTKILTAAEQELNATARHSLEERLNRIDEEQLERAEDAWDYVSDTINGTIAYDFEQKQNQANYN